MAKKLFKKPITKQTYIFIFILILEFFLAMAVAYQPFSDPDSFWHIKTGEYIFANHQIPAKDIFSWYGIEHGLKWINHEWLFDLMIYLVYKTGGFFLVNLVTSALAGSMVLLIYKFTEIRSGNKILSIMISLLATVSTIAYIAPRPQIISFNLLLLLVILLEKEKWYWAIPITILGTNLHGGFYPMYILITLFYCFRKKPTIILLCLLSVIINPYFSEIYLFPFKLQQYAPFKTIQEWNATQLISTNIYDFGVYLILLILVFNTKIKPKDALLSLLIIIQTLSARRHMVFLYILLIPILSPYFNQKLQVIISKMRINKVNKNRVLIISMAILTLSFSINAALLPISNFSEYPVKATKFLKVHNINRVFNMYQDGGYLIFNNIKPALDGRADIFAPIYNKTNFFSHYQNVITLKENYQDFLEKNSIKYLLIKKDIPLYNALKLNKNYIELYQDDKYAIYKRT